MNILATTTCVNLRVLSSRSSYCASQLSMCVSKRYYASDDGVKDSKYVFSKPPFVPRGKQSDTKHFFSKPHLFETNGGADANISHDTKEADLIGQAIAQHRRKKNRQVFTAIAIGVFGTLLGYFVGYRVLYLDEDVFFPLYPAPNIRKPSQTDLKKIDLDYIKMLSRIRVLEKLSQHEMIKDEYGVPLHDEDNINPPQVKQFDLWCEDRDPCLTGVVLRRYRPERATTHIWHYIPFFFQWRLSHRPIYISRSINDFLQEIGVGYSKLYEYVSPDKMYGSLKYEYPIQGDDHAVTIWFLGELHLNKDTLIVYKGNYHVDVKLHRIDLLRKENDKLVRYVLYEKDR